MSRRNLQPLEALLSEISLKCWATRWYSGMPWWGFHFMRTGPQGAGRGQVTPQDVADLKTLHIDLDEGWMLYPLGRPAFIDKNRWPMAFGGGPDAVINETRRLERKLQSALDAEDNAWVDALLQGTRRFY